MEKAKLQNWDYLILSFIIYVLLLISFGFILDSGDMIEVIPSVKKLWHAQLYPNDFYLNYVSQETITERSLFNKLLSYTSDKNFYSLYLYHFISSMFLICAVLKICSLYIQSFSLQFIAALIILLVCSYTSVGENEWYSNAFVSSHVSVIFILWSLWYWLKKNNSIAYLLLIPATLIHIGYGIQWIFIYSIFIGFQHIKERKFSKELYYYLILCLTCIPYILIIYLTTQVAHGHGLDLYYTLEFRIGHHFMIEYAGIFNLIIYILLFISGLWIWRKTEPLNILYYLQGLGLLFYVIGTYGLHKELILKTQWLRTTMWIELFSVIAIAYTIERIYKSEFWFSRIATGLYILLFCFFVFRKNPWQYEINLSEERQIATYCKTHTANDALFITPASWTLFKAVSERSSWIDYKAIAHSPGYLFPWFDRIHRLYKIGLEDRRNRLPLQKTADDNLCKLGIEEIEYLMEEQNVDYFILPICNPITSDRLMKIYSTPHYNLYHKR